MIKYALSALESIYRPGYEYKKAGVMVSGIVPDSQRQKGIYDQADRFRETQLMLLMYELNTKMGRFTLRSAATS